MKVAAFDCKKLEPIINPRRARTMNVALVGGKTYVAGEVLGEVTASGKFDKYADAGAGGLDTARAICEYDCFVDADGNIWHGSQAGELADSKTHTPVYYTGDFRKGDLTGLTAAAVADLGRLIKGVIGDAEAILHMS